MIFTEHSDHALASLRGVEEGRGLTIVTHSPSLIGDRRQN